ncbi:MAG TPA: LacI family DNA-binding transcriptional regulator [Acidimicrobiia bacterium]|nr:LacI family DNA-binding transcriptional regulator [Acidimicrobiia bacterium]
MDASRRRLTSLADVARRAGVSVTTASRVMSASSHPVAERTRRKVIQAAEELDFEPNLVARGLVAQRTSIVGLLVGDVADPAAALVVRGAEDVAFEHGFSVLVADTDGDPDKELAYVRKLRALRADAVILAGSSVAGNGGLDELARQLQLVEEANGVIVRLVPEPGIAADVTWSRDDAYRLLLEHLVALGHETFALVTGPPSRATDAAVAACTAAARAFGADLRPEHVIAVDDAPERAGAIADPLVCVGPRPTAVLAASDAIAAGVALGLRRAGRRVPEDVSVAGIGDLPIAEFGPVPLTTVRAPYRELGAAAMRRARDALEDPGPRGVDVLPVELVVRASTGPAPA